MTLVTHTPLHRSFEDEAISFRLAGLGFHLQLIGGGAQSPSTVYVRKSWPDTLNWDQPVSLHSFDGNDEIIEATYTTLRDLIAALEQEQAEAAHA